MGWFKKKKNKNGISFDFSNIDSNEKAIELFNKKELVRIYLIPIEFGGQEIQMNSLYVPASVQIVKSRFDLMVKNLLLDGKKIGYSVNPEYKENSFIPSKLIIIVTGDAQFTETIEVW